MNGDAATAHGAIGGPASGSPPRSAGVADRSAGASARPRSSQASVRPVSSWKVRAPADPNTDNDAACDGCEVYALGTNACNPLDAVPGSPNCPDCNNNGVCDPCEIVANYPTWAVPTACPLTSDNCDGVTGNPNGIPDTCDTDQDNDDIPDDCDPCTDFDGDGHGDGVDPPEVALAHLQPLPAPCVGRVGDVGRALVMVTVGACDARH